MKTRMMRKLHSAAGESIAEALIAVLVIAVASVLLAGMITATNNMVANSKTKMDEYYSANTFLETFDEPAENTSAVKFQGSVTVSVSTGGTEMPISIPAIDVEYEKNQTFAGTPVVAYQVSEGS